MATAGAKVTVASKLPMALELQLCDKRTTQVRNGNNSWNEEVFVKSGKIVTINGTAYPAGQPPEGMPDRPSMIAGAALTPGVDKAFWDAWLAQNKDTPMVKNGMVFAHEKIDAVKGKARDAKNVLSGLDPINPKGDRRMPRKLKGKVGSITVGEDEDGGAGAEELIAAE